MVTDCKDCTFNSGDGYYCGKGLTLDTDGCTGYIAGTRPEPIRLIPRWDTFLARGCFLPVHLVTSSYQIIIPYYSYEGMPPSTPLMGRMADFLQGAPSLLQAIRYECLFDEDYCGSKYIRPRGISITVQGDRRELSLHLNLTDCGGAVLEPAGHTDYNLPPHYWWLDVTARPGRVHRMHNLIRVVYSLAYIPMSLGDTRTTLDRLAHPRLGPMLRAALVLGLELKDRPTGDWYTGIYEIDMGSYDMLVGKNFRKLLVRRWEQVCGVGM